MKIAVISDIHANFEALKSTLKDIKKNKVDSIICLGDIIGKGINANQCVDLIRENNVICIRGNTDVRFVDNPDKFKDNPVEQNRIIFNKSLLSPENIEFLKSLPFSFEFYLSGLFVRCFHSTPYSEFGFVNDFDTDITKKIELFKGTDKTETQKMADVVVFGHLHYSSMNRLYNRILINTGSVGSSACAFYEDDVNAGSSEITKAHYVILEGQDTRKNTGDFSVSFRSVDYDIEKELKSNKNNPELESYIRELTEGRYRNIERVREAIKAQGYKNLPSNDK